VKQIKKLKVAPIVKIIIVFMVFSFLFGVLASFKVSVKTDSLTFQKSFLEIFLMTFIFNYWLIFLLWQLGKTKGIFLICYFLVFLKCLLFGITFGINLRSLNSLSFLKYFILDLSFLYPLFGVMLYDISSYNLYDNKKYSSQIQVIVYTIWTLIYSLICGFIGSKI
jgi:hypothetical protein